MVFLRCQQLVFSRARQFIESRRRFRRQHRHHGVVGKFRHLGRQEIHSHLPQFRQRGLVVFSVVFRSCPRCFAALVPLFALFLFFGSRGRLFLRGLLLFVQFPFECGFQIPGAQLSPIQIRVPIEYRGLYRAILAISPLNRVQD